MSDLVNRTQQALLTEAINRKRELLDVAVRNHLGLGKMEHLEPEDRKEATALLYHFRKRCKARLP